MKAHLKCSANNFFTNLFSAVIFFSAFFGPGSDTALAQTPADSWKPTWADEFEGDTIDRKKWDFDLGNGFYNYGSQQWISGWGNDELQYYTDQPNNVFVADGMLHIKVIKESRDGFGYTSARVKSRGRDQSPLFNQRYGRFEFRAKLPTGQGIWPALWMLPQEETYGTWAASGEIDILETRGQKPHEILGTLHFGGQWPANKHSGETFQLPNNGTIADFHVYALEWEPGEIRWYFDGQQYATESSWWSSNLKNAEGGALPKDAADINPWPAPFDHPFYIVMNVAVGGKFLGDPDETTEFPAEMLIDYVRVYEKVGGYGSPKEPGEKNLPFASEK